MSTNYLSINLLLRWGSINNETEIILRGTLFRWPVTCTKACAKTSYVRDVEIFTCLLWKYRYSRYVDYRLGCGVPLRIVIECQAFQRILITTSQTPQPFEVSVDQRKYVWHLFYHGTVTSRGSQPI